MKTVLLEKIYQTDNLVYLVFEKGELTFTPGQAVLLRKDGVERYYSITTTPEDPVVTLFVRLKDGGEMSSILREAETGEVFEFGKVVGKLSPEHVGRTLFLVGGTGIAPVRSLLRATNGKERDVVVLYSVRYPWEIAFRGEMERMRGVRFVPTVTRMGWEGETGHITKEMVEKYAPDYKERNVIVVGPRGFVSAMLGIVRELGVDMKNVHVEGW